MVSPNSKSGAAGSSSSVPNSPYVSNRKTVPSRQAIALISDHGDPAADIGKDEAGGQNVYVRQVGEALAKLGWQVDLFTRKTRSDDTTIVQHTPHCRTIRLTAGPKEFIPRDELFAYMPEFVEAFQKFQSKEGTNYPLVHTNYWMAAWVGLTLKQQHNIQLVHTYHSLGALKYQAVEQRPAIAETRLAIEQQILEQADCIVATSPQEQDTLRSLISHEGRIEVIPGGTDLNIFHTMPKTDARASLGFDPNEAIILYVGRFDPRKGIETLVRACALLQDESGRTQGEMPTPLPPFRLVIVGGTDPDPVDSSERDRIEQLVQATGLANRTLFVGQVGHDRLPLYYTAADVCVIPSYYEPFGLVAIEAMACGTPVVASDVGGLKFTVIPEETGLLVPSRDPIAFAQAIDRVLSDELWARKLRRQASVRVQQNFSWSAVAARLSDLYRRLLAQSICDVQFLSEQLPHQETTSAYVALSQSAPVSQLTKVS